jgi:uncharacterized protein (DUF2235 family)
MSKRNFVICCDGTNNQFGTENTNVVRLIQSLERNPVKQRLYYDPGVGTLPEPGTWTWLGKKISDVAGLAFGGGLSWKIGEAYCYLMDYWEPGDDVFLFGFSRGAYSVRVLAGLLHLFGLMPRGNQNLVPYVMRMFKAAGKKNGEEFRKHIDLCNAFRNTFARIPPNSVDRRFPIHFLGVWDTVSSVGWVWDPAKFPYTRRNESINIIRHAVSIDERRSFFRQNLMTRADRKDGRLPQDLKEYWFPGVHCDVGGGYPETGGGLWQGAFEWMLDEAIMAGLHVEPDRRRAILQRPSSLSPQWTQESWADMKHESLTLRWWPAEFFPKLRALSRERPIRVPMLGLGRHREVEKNALIHETILKRIRLDHSYEPPNLSKQFIRAVRALPIVPEVMPYRENGGTGP